VIGRRTRTEHLRTEPAAAYRTTFAPQAPEPLPGGALPSGWEGLYFPFDTHFADLRPDGSPGAGDVVPEIDLPRRLYAGEDTRFHRPLHYGDLAEQCTTLGRVEPKQGRSGRMVFADVERRYLVSGELAVTSVWHDVFLPGADPAQSSSQPVRAPARLEQTDWAWSAQLALDRRQLFRYSAITFNTHRVHYDLGWARDDEGLPDLLVHGPLMRMLLLDFATKSAGGQSVREFSLRSLAPTYVDTPVTLVGGDAGEGAEVYAVDDAGRKLAHGRVGWAAD
jgi:3-methylfumaryl-CoA hydratase